VAESGDTLSRTEVADLALGKNLSAGLYVCAHNKDVLEKAVFWNVRIVIPPEEQFVPYRGYIGSTLELVEVEEGNRTVVYHSPDSLQAPNWLPDGKALISNRTGHLGRRNLTSRLPELLYTDFATSINSDHHPPDRPRADR
jgi:hypothetical protein